MARRYGMLKTYAEVEGPTKRELEEMKPETKNLPYAECPDCGGPSEYDQEINGALLCQSCAIDRIMGG